MGAGAIVSPFGGMSLTELRSRASVERQERVERVERDASALTLVAPSRAALSGLARLDEPARSTTEPSFNDLVFTMHDVSAKEAAWVDEMSGLSEVDEDDLLDLPRRSSVRVAILLAVTILVPLLAGMAIYLGLLWTTSAISAPPDWLPKQLWFPPWPVSTSR